jgi:hypothetical protein
VTRPAEAPLTGLTSILGDTLDKTKTPPVTIES